MYQPAHGRFAVADPATLLSSLVGVAPATLVTHGSAGLSTSILPMLFEPLDGEHGTLRGHLARPNPQWRLGEDGPADAVAIFHGPDAYVSPSWYEEKKRTGRVVPTWNYVVVIAHGSLIVHTDEAWLLEHVRALVERHEARFPEPWSIDDAPPGYIRGQAKGIVGVELRITRLEAKRKLGQNRSALDIAGAIEGLGAGTPMERAVAEAMRNPEEPVLHSRPHGGDREE